MPFYDYSKNRRVMWQKVLMVITCWWWNHVENLKASGVTELPIHMKGLLCISLNEKLEVNWETCSWLGGQTQWSESALIIQMSDPLSDPRWHTEESKTGFINFCISQKLPFSFLKVAQIDHCIVEQIQYKIKLNNLWQCL